MEKIYFNFINHLGLLVKGIIFKKSSDNIAVLVHGFGGLMNDPQFKSYKKELLSQGYSVCMFDFTNGVGKSQRSRKISFTYQDLKEELSEVLRFLKNNGFSKFQLIGHSLGGGICIDLTTENKFNIKTVMLINPLIFNTFEFQIKEIDFIKTYKRNQNKFYGIFRCMPSFTKFLDDILNFDIRNKLEKVKIPVLVVEGRYDKVVKFSKNKELLCDKFNNYTFKEYNFPHTFRSKRNRKILTIVTNDIFEFINKNNDI